MLAYKNYSDIYGDNDFDFGFQSYECDDDDGSYYVNKHRCKYGKSCYKYHEGLCDSNHICAYYRSRRGCKYGDGCRFEHLAPELGSAFSPMNVPCVEDNVLTSPVTIPISCVPSYSVPADATFEIVPSPIKSELTLSQFDKAMYTMRVLCKSCVPGFEHVEADGIFDRINKTRERLSYITGFHMGEWILTMLYDAVYFKLYSNASYVPDPPEVMPFSVVKFESQGSSPSIPFASCNVYEFSAAAGFSIADRVHPKTVGEHTRCYISHTRFKTIITTLSSICRSRIAEYDTREVQSLLTSIGNNMVSLSNIIGPVNEWFLSDMYDHIYTILHNESYN
ncbi:MAG: hypothetical protein Gaeavirus34_1 [Gaeavirus sp.]|uniref:C3H1-type domain-containing protein n=1 Tax=Gaeavirus sp. TaxID=2487767 RepID=A0A3G4ZZD5_9VIRU|nr:MAG: hypothetical protein Gaeavirus34_1 [Gaeavirus sp.]